MGRSKVGIPLEGFTLMSREVLQSESVLDSLTQDTPLRSVPKPYTTTITAVVKYQFVWNLATFDVDLPAFFD